MTPQPESVPGAMGFILVLAMGITLVLAIGTVTVFLIRRRRAWQLVGAFLVVSVVGYVVYTQLRASEGGQPSRALADGPPATSPVEVELADGTRLSGTLLRYGDRCYRVRLEDGEIRDLPETKVRSISFGVKSPTRPTALTATAVADPTDPQFLLALLSNSGDPGHHFELLAPDRFGGIFARSGSGPRLDGPSADPTSLEEGATVSFPAGAFPIDVRTLCRTLPRELIFEGAGMSRTLVSLNDTFRDALLKDGVFRLTFRDMTIHCSDHYLTDIRGAAILLHLERCRVVGFDMGAGGSTMLNARTAVFWAEDSRFEAGFGRAPGFGNLFRVHEGLLARLDRCVCVGPFRSIVNRGGTTIFADCEFLNADRDLAGLEQAPDGVRFERCRVASVMDPVAAHRKGKRSFAELNPDWRAADEEKPGRRQRGTGTGTKGPDAVAIGGDGRDASDVPSAAGSTSGAGASPDAGASGAVPEEKPREPASGARPPAELETGWTRAFGGNERDLDSWEMTDCNSCSFKDGILTFEHREKELETLSIMYGKDDWRDYEIELEVRIEKGPVYIDVHGTLEGPDDERVRSWQPGVKLDEGDHGWRKIRIEVRGKLLNFEQPGVRITAKELKYPSGPFEIRAQKGACVHVRSVRVKVASPEDGRPR